MAEARACAVAMTAWAHDHGRPVVGFGQATLAGVMELIRSVNGAAKRLGENPTNQSTDLEIMRMFLAETSFERSTDAAVVKTAAALGTAEKEAP